MGISFSRCSVCDRALEDIAGCCLITYWLINGKPVCKECAKKMKGRCSVCGDYKGWCKHTSIIGDKRKMTKEELLQEIKSLRMSCNAFYQLMIDRIRDLEKENAELKEKLNFSTQYYQGEKIKQQLTKAKKLLNMFLRLHYNPIVDEHTLFCKVEQFLNSEVEK